MIRVISGRGSFRTALGVAVIASVIFAAAGALFAMRSRTARVKQDLTATAAVPDATGKARLAVRGSKKGKFSIVAAHLKGGKQYDVIVGGVKVGTLATTQGGKGRAGFSTRPRAKDAVLGFDPRGDQVLVRDAEDGEDALVGDMPHGDPNEIACCVSDHDGEAECESMTPDECTAAGGMPVGVPGGTTAASCLPNPCATTPPAGGGIVCCTNATHDDESEAECEEVAAEADCATAGGTVVQAASCDPNPCAVTPPANVVACCTVENGDGQGGGETECEVTSAEACTAAGGMAAGAATCHPDPCGGSSGSDDGGDGGDGASDGDD